MEGQHKEEREAKMMRLTFEIGLIVPQDASGRQQKVLTRRAATQEMNTNELLKTHIRATLEILVNISVIAISKSLAIVLHTLRSHTSIALASQHSNNFLDFDLLRFSLYFIKTLRLVYQRCLHGIFSHFVQDFSILNQSGHLKRSQDTSVSKEEKTERMAGANQEDTLCLTRRPEKAFPCLFFPVLNYITKTEWVPLVLSLNDCSSRGQPMFHHNI